MNNQTVRELRAIAKERGLRRYYKLRKAELVVLLANAEIERAATRGYIDLVKLCRRRGATAFNEAMRGAAWNGYIEIVKLCREYGATNFDAVMVCAAKRGHIEIVKLCLECGANLNEVMAYNTVRRRERAPLMKLFRDWIGFEAVHHELFQYHHKREFFRRIHDELLPIAWHPDRFWNWCVDVEEKGFLGEMWKS